MKRFYAVVAVVVVAMASGAVAHEKAHGHLKIVHPFTVEPIDPKARDVTVLMTIHNLGKIADRLVSASSPLAEKAEIGTAPPTDDHTVDLPAGGTVAFSRTGARIELKGLTERLTGYETFPLWLTFEKAGRVEVEVLVEENEEDMTGH